MLWDLRDLFWLRFSRCSRPMAIGEMQEQSPEPSRSIPLFTQPNPRRSELPLGLVVDGMLWTRRLGTVLECIGHASTEDLAV